ncbi:uncharacterized protein YbjT (DUF2867 family) [Acinetobacter calcoaceticus]|uniref:Uncharacterized protein YbjT (DUF2867 family) n=1 Tax=Acinetobacter calcoaceticus TaxID=471 RepID=A0A4R1XX85_ACICA|nr:uncharacterized protein YbjT (DUF2867 family) [Acinetobacter calcoaceticus]
MTQIIQQAIVIGGTGLVGRNLITQLNQCSSCEKITAIVRHYEDSLASLAKVEQIICADFSTLTALQVQGHSHAFSCLGSTIAKAGSQAAFYQIDFELNAHFAALFQGSATDYLLVSAMGADPKSRFFYNRVKGELEQRIKTLDLAQVSIIRPSLLLGERSEQRRMEQWGQQAFSGLGKLLPAKFRYKPVTGEQVASTLVSVAQSQIEKFQIYDNLAIQAH